ncbi:MULTISPECIES: C13 family peptidase [unclassified Brevundimonas]|uniref:C13 family peptidase n=1 Tax=unclassified Brevundimonas TaxID=2622653 RepID=UPI0025BF30E8|nr:MULTISPECIES: C13 family peptidase [unclassified Brevundimonas]
MFKALAGLAAAVGLTFGMSVTGQAQSRFDGWSSVVIAADWRDGAGKPIDAFDNARRDLSTALVGAGLPRDLHRSITLNPSKPDAAPPAEALRQMGETLSSGSRGCLLYLTSHGSPGELVFGDTRGIAPADLSGWLRRWCDVRPTIVVLSACYSGSFVDALKAPNRLIMTAARRDRSSFGCGAGETYPWYDACILETLPQADDFLTLAQMTRTCVSRRETDAEIDTPSEPQVFVGSEMQYRLPVLRFNRAQSFSSAN